MTDFEEADYAEPESDDEAKQLHLESSAIAPPQVESSSTPARLEHEDQFEKQLALDSESELQGAKDDSTAARASTLGSESKPLAKACPARKPRCPALLQDTFQIALGKWSQGESDFRIDLDDGQYIFTEHGVQCKLIRGGEWLMGDTEDGIIRLKPKEDGTLIFQRRKKTEREFVFLICKKAHEKTEPAATSKDPGPSEVENSSSVVSDVLPAQKDCEKDDIRECNVKAPEEINLVEVATVAPEKEASLKEVQTSSDGAGLSESATTTPEKDTGLKELDASSNGMDSSESAATTPEKGVCLEHAVDLSASDDEDEDDLLSDVCKMDVAPTPLADESKTNDLQVSEAPKMAFIEGAETKACESQADVRHEMVQEPVMDEVNRPKPKKMPKRMAKKPPDEHVQANEGNAQAEKRLSSEADVGEESRAAELEKLFKEKLKDDKASEEKRKHRVPVVLTKDTDIQVTSHALAALKSWFEDETRKNEHEFEIIETNRYLRRYMHEACARDFPDLLVVSRPTAREGVSKMIGMRLTEEQVSELQLQRQRHVESTNKVCQHGASSFEAASSRDWRRDIALSRQRSIGSFKDQILDASSVARQVASVPEGVRVIPLKRNGGIVKSDIDAPRTRASQRVICRLWAKTGTCRFGDACKFTHENVAVDEKVAPAVSEDLIPDWKRLKTGEAGDPPASPMALLNNLRSIWGEMQKTKATNDAEDEKMKISEPMQDETQAEVDPYLEVGMETTAECEEPAKPDLAVVDVISDDEENPIAAEFRLAFEELPEAEREGEGVPLEKGKLVDEFMNAFSELPDSSTSTLPSIKPTRSVKKFCCRSGHKLEKGAYFDRSCDACARTATAFRCSEGCEYDLCVACYEAAEARSVASPQQSSTSSKPTITTSKRKAEVACPESSRPELKFARQYIAQRSS
mmetsp:Transcript_87536/g.137080  ORF Transcript_87536/g.137080 Transcript_87536/m.137080 type:complete len:920 (+) Transcript_87536:80-2839(+)